MVYNYVIVEFANGKYLCYFYYMNFLLDIPFQESKLNAIVLYEVHQNFRYTFSNFCFFWAICLVEYSCSGVLRKTVYCCEKVYFTAFLT